MSTLENIDKLAVYEALETIDKLGWNRDQKPVHLWLELGFRLYPPKIVIEKASGGELKHHVLSSWQAARHLRSLGFHIVSVKDAKIYSSTR